MLPSQFPEVSVTSEPSLQRMLREHLDMQIAINLRSMILFYREAMPMLRAAGTADGALVVNTSSITGKIGTAQLSVYSATKHGIVGFTEAMNQELRHAGIVFAITSGLCRRAPLPIATRTRVSPKRCGSSFCGRPPHDVGPGRAPSRRQQRRRRPHGHTPAKRTGLIDHDHVSE